MRYYADNELDDCVVTRDDGGAVHVDTVGRTIGIDAGLLASASSDWLTAEGDGDVVTLCGRYRYRHVGMTVRSQPVYTLVADLEERDVPHDRA